MFNFLDFMVNLNTDMKGQSHDGTLYPLAEDSDRKKPLDVMLMI